MHPGPALDQLEQATHVLDRVSGRASWTSLLQVPHAMWILEQVLHATHTQGGGLAQAWHVGQPETQFGHQVPDDVALWAKSSLQVTTQHPCSKWLAICTTEKYIGWGGVKETC